MFLFNAYGSIYMEPRLVQKKPTCSDPWCTKYAITVHLVDEKNRKNNEIKICSEVATINLMYPPDAATVASRE